MVPQQHTSAPITEPNTAKGAAAVAVRASHKSATTRVAAKHSVPMSGVFQSVGATEHGDPLVSSRL